MDWRSLTAAWRVARSLADDDDDDILLTFTLERYYCKDGVVMNRLLHSGWH